MSCLLHKHGKRLFLFHLLSHGNVGNKAVESVLRGRDDHVGNLRVEVQLLDLVLALPVTPSRIITACTNSSCDGTSGIWSAASASSERSQMVSCWSLDTASTDESCGDHSTDVIGAPR